MIQRKKAQVIEEITKGLDAFPKLEVFLLLILYRSKVKN